jgi:hypothetical protein
MRMAALAFSLLCVTGVSTAMAASTEADYKAALAAAEVAERAAGDVKNQWTTTEQALAAAQKAAAAGDFAAAVSTANNAKALAEASIAQAKEQQDAWKAAVIR